MFKHIAADVFTATDQRQRPELSLSAIGDFFLRGNPGVGGSVTSPVPPPVDPCAGAEAHWRSTEAIASREAYQDHLARFSGCNFAGLARTRLAALSRPPTPPPLSVMSGFIFPDSDRRHLSGSELSGLSKEQLRIARNEIFARKGRFFRDPALASYFSRFPWYRPNAWEVTLNAIEQANVTLIESMER